MKNKSVIGRVVKTVSHSKFLIALSLVFSVASVVLSLYIPVLAGRAIDGIASAGNVDFGIVIRALATLAVCALVSGVLQWVMTSVNNRIAYNAVRELRDAAFGRIQHLPVSYVDSHPYGDIVSRITADAEAFSDGLVLGFSQLFTGVVTVAVTLGFMLSISPFIALAVVVLTPLSLFTARFIANRTYDMFKKQSETRGEQTSLMNEMIQNQKTVQAFSYGERALGRFDGVNEKLRKYSLRATFFSSLTNPTTRFINNLIYAVVGLAGGLFAVAFYACLAFAALTSSVSLLELDAAFLVDEFHFSRAGASLACSAAVMTAGIFCALSFGPMADVTLLGKNVFGWFDFLTSNLFLPIGGLAVALLAGVFCWPRVAGAVTASEKVPPLLLAIFRVLLVVACPALVLAVLVTGLI